MLNCNLFAYNFHSLLLGLLSVVTFYFEYGFHMQQYFPSDFKSSIGLLQSIWKLKYKEE